MQVMQAIKRIIDNRKPGVALRITIAISMILLIIIISEIFYIQYEKSRKDGIHFSDASLEFAVETYMKDFCVMEEDAVAVRVLDLSETPVTIYDFNDFAYFQNVEQIIIKGSQIVSFDGINRFDSLKTLIVSDSQIKDTSALHDLDLYRVSLTNCQLDGVLEMSNMNYLADLNLTGNKLQGLRGEYPALKVLRLSNNSIKSISSIDLPEGLEELYLNGNPIEDYSGLEEFDNIYKLDLRQTAADDFSVIQGMEGINSLYIDEDDMNDDLEYLYDNFRDGDFNRKREYLFEKYRLGDN